MTVHRMFLSVIISCLSFISCVRIKNQSDFFSKNIDLTYYQMNNLDKNETTIDFHIQLKSPLPNEISIEMIYFNLQKSKNYSVDKKHVLGRFYEQNQKNDLVLNSDSKKEYGNKPPLVLVRGMKLLPKEAIIEYKIGANKYFYRIPSVQKKE